MKIKPDKSLEIQKVLDMARQELEAKFADETEIVEVKGGLDSLLNKQVLILCAGYFYEGKLTGVNAIFVELEDAVVVYNPVNFTKASIHSATRDKLPAKKWHIQLGSVESYGELE